MTSTNRYYRLKPADEATTGAVAVEKDRWLKGLKAKVKHPKVRTGCLTCKQRRLKCDEARPSCQRCTLSGRECAGYSSPQFVISELPSTEAYDKPQDGEILRYFLREGSTLVSAYANGLKRFSFLIAAQLDQDHPAVKHALLSLAARTKSVHLRSEGPRKGPDARSLRSASLAHYNIAIRSLTQTKSKPQVSPDVYLVCGLLFAATEQWPHRDMVPAMHILNAFRLLLLGNNKTLSSDLREGMLPFMGHLGRSAVAFYDEVPIELEDSMREFTWFEIPPKPVPWMFETVDQAYEHLDELLKFVLALASDDLLFHERAFRMASELSYDIMQALVMTKADPEFSKDLHAQLSYKSMLMHQRTLQLMLDATSSEGEEGYDWKTSDFEFILYEAEEILRMEKLVNQQDRVFRPSLGVLSPLFLVATKCRISSIRHRAIKSLHASRRRERTWNSCIATMLARLVVSIEEKHCKDPGQGLVSEEHRVRLDAVAFDQHEGQMSVSYRFAPYDDQATTQHRTLSWRAKDAIDNDFECVCMSKKVLRASGYTGILLLSPPISCQCGDDNNFAE